MRDSLPGHEIDQGQEHYTVDFYSIQGVFRGDVVVFLLNGTAAGVSEIRDPIAGVVRSGNYRNFYSFPHPRQSRRSCTHVQT